MEARTVSVHSAKDIAEWCGGLLIEEINALDESVVTPGINVPCGDGETRRASVGDVVFQNSKGKFEIVKQ